jgi:hypothetical protein
MSGRRCGDLGERCKRSQHLQLDLACGPRCAWTRDPRPYMPKAPVSRHAIMAEIAPGPQNSRVKCQVADGR